MSASEQEMSSSPPASESQPQSLEDLVRSQNPWLSLLLSSILGLNPSSPPNDRLEEESDEIRAVRERFYLINPTARSMIVIEGPGNLEALLRDLPNKEGPLPASKASIEALPVVAVAVAEKEAAECAICLAEFEEEAKEMPCKHRYHSGCIEKWLGIHGSCPVCRYKMPAEEEEEIQKRGGGENAEGGGERREGEDGVWIGFYVGRGDRSDSDPGSVTGSNGNSPDSEVDGSSSTAAEDMEIDNN